jgi:hypothetical protein
MERERTAKLEVRDRPEVSKKARDMGRRGIEALMSWDEERRWRME